MSDRDLDVSQGENSVKGLRYGLQIKFGLHSEPRAVLSVLTRAAASITQQENKYKLESDPVFKVIITRDEQWYFDYYDQKRGRLYKDSSAYTTIPITDLPPSLQADLIETHKKWHTEYYTGEAPALDSVTFTEWNVSLAFPILTREEEAENTHRAYTYQDLIMTLNEVPLTQDRSGANAQHDRRGVRRSFSTTPEAFKHEDAGMRKIKIKQPPYE